MTIVHTNIVVGIINILIDTYFVQDLLRFIKLLRFYQTQRPFILLWRKDFSSINTYSFSKIFNLIICAKIR